MGRSERRFDGLYRTPQDCAKETLSRAFVTKLALRAEASSAVSRLGRRAVRPRRAFDSENVHSRGLGNFGLAARQNRAGWFLMRTAAETILPLRSSFTSGIPRPARNSLQGSNTLVRQLSLPVIRAAFGNPTA